MDLLRSSIMGKEFVNYRKSTVKEDRVRFSKKVRCAGIGNIPIVIDSVDADLSNALSEKSGRYMKHGVEMVFHMDATVPDVLKEVKIHLMQKDHEQMIKDTDLTLGLEDGTFPDGKKNLGELYKEHRNRDDKILYFLLSKEQSMYAYIMSILAYLKESLLKVIGIRR